MRLRFSAARLILARTQTLPNIRIRALDLSTGKRWTVVEDFADFHQPVLTNDGRQLLFLMM